MKTKLILVSLLALSTTLNAQDWSLSGNSIGGSDFFGTTSNSDLKFYTNNAERMRLSTGGDLGIGNNSPADKLHVTTSIGNGGLTITQTGSGGAGITLDNVTASGQNWGILSYGNGNSQGSGNFGVYNYTNGRSDFLIDGTTGNIGVSSTSPGLAKMHILNYANPGSALQWGINSQIRQVSPVTGGGSFLPFIGVQGDATTDYECESLMYGVVGTATNGQENYGGDFIATSTCDEGLNIGIHATGYGNSNPAKNWAAKFDGETYCTTGAWNSSDKKLKKDITPFKDALNKIKLLNPCTYNFKTDVEFKDMQLPKDNQIGLIAQELETVFPQLVKEVPEMTKYNEKGKIVAYTPKFKSIQYTSLIPVIIAGINEQQSSIEDQQTKLNALQKQMDDQIELINQLMEKLSSANTGVAQNSLAGQYMTFDQNIPNPFNGETTIKYDIPLQIKIAYLMIYDLSGKQIAKFPITEKGSSSITITSEKLSAGIYIYSIVADGKLINSKKMVVAEK